MSDCANLAKGKRAEGQYASNHVCSCTAIYRWYAHLYSLCELVGTIRGIHWPRIAVNPLFGVFLLSSTLFPSFEVNLGLDRSHQI
jgi:hypothetical protein